MGSDGSDSSCCRPEGCAKGLKCCGNCCSFKCWGITVVVFSVFLALVNPVLDYVIIGGDDRAMAASYVEGVTTYKDYTALMFVTEDQETNIGSWYLMLSQLPKWLMHSLRKL